jgi:putative flippase GtrA
MNIAGVPKTAASDVIVALSPMYIYYLLSNLVGIDFATLWNSILSAQWIWKQGLERLGSAKG